MSLSINKYMDKIDPAWDNYLYCFKDAFLLLVHPNNAYL